MKAVEYVVKNGWNMAKIHLDVMDAENWNNGFYDNLKRLVESWELVESFFNLNSLGFEKSIEIANKQIEELESNGAIEFWHRWDDELSCTVERMKRAIADVESVGGGV